MNDEDDNKPLLVVTEPSFESENNSTKKSHSRNCSNCSQRFCNTMQSSGDIRLSDLSWKDICKILFDLLKIYAKNSWKLLGLALLGVVLVYMLVGGPITFLAILIGIIAKFYYVQDTLLYHPNMPNNSRLFSHTPETYPLPGVDETENLMITTKDNVNIHIQILMQSVEKRAQAPTIIFFHGNAGNIGHRLPNALGMFLHLGANIVLVEYRGYGRSTGNPSEYGLYYDAETALDFVLNHPKLGSSGVMIFGRSLGGAIAIYLASHSQYSQKIRAVMVENTFTTLPKIGKYLFNIPLVQYLPTFCFRNKYPSLARVKRISIPSLFISGQADTLVPKEMMTTLFEACGSVLKRLARIEGGSHNDTWLSEGYFEAITHFLAEVRNLKHNPSTPPTGIYDMPASSSHDVLKGVRIS